MAASTAIVNTATGFTNPIQWTSTAGGTTIEWYTNQLQATTLSGIVVGNIRALESNAAANATVRLEIAVTDGTGGNVRLFGSACPNVGLTTSEAVYTVYVSGPDTAIAAGDRIRLRISIDDFEAAMGNTYTATMYYNASSPNVSGDTYVTFPVALTQYFTTASFSSVYVYDNRTNTYSDYTSEADNTTVNDVPGPYHYTTGAT